MLTTLKQPDLDGALKQFGLESFRDGQREVISAIVAGHECLCVMPTGSGKSLCFQMPSVVRPGLTIVVSPLIALMKDQVDSLCGKGIPAALINSTLSSAEQQQRLQEMTAGKYKLVYVAPERLRNSRFLEAIRATPIQLLAIDEAHCISQWGHDFRPDYARLGRFREWLGNVQTVALTATATPRVRQDIVEVLRLSQPKQFMSGFARPNLHFGVVHRQSDREKDEELSEFLKHEPGAGIIYASTRKRCESLVEWIQQKLKIPVGAYHAGLLLEQRRAIQERFMNNQLRIIVATNAFGMGIDKPDLRFVIHYNIPGSLEAYYQEAGRAGRDGGQSRCVLLYSYQDRYIQEFFIENNYPPREIIQSVYEFMQRQTADPIELTHEEIRDALGLSVSAEAIGSSLQIIARTEVIERLESSGGMAMVKIDNDLPTLVDLLPRDATVKRKVLRAVERAIGQRRSEEVYVHPRWLMQHTELDRDALNRHLRELVKLGHIDYIAPFRGRAVRFLKREVPFSQLGIDFENLTKRKEAEYDRLNQVIRFAQSPRCRQAAILEYFGDPSAAPCGQCDRCCGVAGWPRFNVAGATDQTAARSMEGKIVEEPHIAADADTKIPWTSQMQLQLLRRVLSGVERIHGRLGKQLIAQFLCGSNNAKVQKLRLHRLPGFGLLDGLTQIDAAKILDAMLTVGLLSQQEVNRNRPTVSISPDLQANRARIDEIISQIVLPAALQIKLIPFAQRMLAPETVQAQSSVLTSEPAQPTQSPNAAGDAKPLQRSETPHRSEPTQSEPPRRSEPPPVTSDSKPNTNLATSSPGDSRPKPATAPAIVAQAATGDWVWSLQLLQDGYFWSDVMAIRRKSDLELARDLQEALKHGHSIQRAWLSTANPNDALDPTVGQQRLQRELQRRTAAGVG